MVSATEPDSQGLYMQKARKPVNKSFIVQVSAGECPVCFDRITRGQRARYNPEGVMVHHRHTEYVSEPKICSRCWLTMPCECE